MACRSYLDYVQSLFDRAFSIERKPSIDLGRNLSGHNLQNFLSKLHKEPIQSRIDLFVQRLAVLDTILDRYILKLGIFCLFRGGEDERGVCCSILGLVFSDGCGM